MGSRFKRNGDYLQVLQDDVVITSLTPDFLCQVAKAKKAYGTKPVLAQIHLLKKPIENSVTAQSGDNV